MEDRNKEISLAKKKDGNGKETIGWLRVQGTNIDYPIWYGPGYNYSAAVDDFAWTDTFSGKLGNILFLSGHNIKNLSSNPRLNDKTLSRFEQLMSFTYYDFAKDNQFIQLSMNDNNYIYQIYSISYVDSVDNFYSSFSKKTMKNYINESLESSIYKYNIDVNDNDYIISLDTCTRMYGSGTSKHFRVNGRMLRDGEKIKNNKVSKSSKYKEIEDLMKGGESYDEA